MTGVIELGSQSTRSELACTACSQVALLEPCTECGCQPADLHDGAPDEIYNIDALLPRTFSQSYSQSHDHPHPLRSDSLVADRFAMMNSARRTFSTASIFGPGAASNFAHYDLGDLPSLSFDDDYIDLNPMGSLGESVGMVPISASAIDASESEFDLQSFSELEALPLPPLPPSSTAHPHTRPQALSMPSSPSSAVSASQVSPLDLGSILISELSHKMNAFHNVRQAAQALFEKVAGHDNATIDKFSDDADSDSQSQSQSQDGAELARTESMIAAVRDARRCFASHSQQMAHTESLAALCFMHAFNQQEADSNSRKKNARAARRALTVPRVSALLKECNTSGGHTPERLERYQPVVSAIIAECEQQSALSLTQQVLEQRPLIVDACRPSFMQYCGTFASLTRATVDLTVSIINCAVQLGICQRRNHNSLSAAALFLAMSLECVPITQHDFCKKISLTEVTLRKVIRELGNEWSKLVPTNYKPKQLPHFIAKKQAVLSA